MLVLTFMVGEFLYGFEAVNVAEVVPPVNCKPLPKAPGFVSGVFNYRGRISPVIDLPRLALDKPSVSMMSSRIIMIDIADINEECERGSRYLGLRAEKVTDMVKLSDDLFESPGADIPDAPWLGRVAKMERGMLQLINPAKLLDEDLQRILFPEDGHQVTEREAEELHYPEKNMGD